MKILIIDDSMLAEYAIKSYFVKLGHEVVGLARNGEVGKSMFEEKEPDLVSYSALTIKGERAFERADLLVTDIENGNIKREEDAITIRSLFFSLLPTGWKDTTLDGKHFRSAIVTLDPTTNIPVVQITFDAEGGELF